MKTIIAGSRDIGNIKYIKEAVSLAKLYENIEVTEIVCGMARGVDTLGYMYGIDNNIPIKTFKPNYERYGRYMAPKYRNTEMAEYADALIAVWDNKSRGTADMIGKAKNKGLKTFIFDIL